MHPDAYFYPRWLDSCVLLPPSCCLSWLAFKTKQPYGQGQFIQLLFYKKKVPSVRRQGKIQNKCSNDQMVLLS